jgi:uncharacterized membrane protein
MRETANQPVLLDGAVFYEHVYPQDFLAAKWIKENVKPEGGKIPVVLEAWGGSYAPAIDKAGGRVATLTGFPTVLGWDFHEVQWRGSSDKAVIRGGPAEDTIMRREADIDSIYISKDLSQVKDLLGKYGVGFVYVGDTEREKYKGRADNFDKFAQVGKAVWSGGGSVLYKVGS